MQLELRWFAPGSVRAVLTDYLAMRSENITAETREHDYRVRAEWLLDVLGEATLATDIDYVRMEAAARRDRDVLRDVTIRKRLAFWRSAVDYAAMRRVVPLDAVPQLPPWLRDDGRRGTDFYTLGQFQEFRLALPPGRFRRFADLCFWSAMHTVDIAQTARRHLEPDHVWDGTEARGRWWRRNHKNLRVRGKQARIQPCWVPMEPELRELAAEWLAEPGHPDQLLLGPMNNVRRTFVAAAERANLNPVRANLGLRASHSSLLLARGYSYEYVRIVLGHVGEVQARQVGEHLVARAVKHGTTLSHYMRPSPDIMRPR